MFKFIANTNTRINQLKSGEVHVVSLVPWDKYREISGLSSIVVHKTAGNAYEHVTLNERQFPPFADVRVRRALIHALDRELFPKNILDGLAPAAPGPLHPPVPRPSQQTHPRWSRARGARSHPAGVVGVYRSNHAVSVRPGARAD